MAACSCAFAFILLVSGSYAVDSIRFFVIGDMGGVDVKPYTTYYERCTAQEMGAIADVYSPQFILELGDNFYFDGVKNVEDMRFNLTFESVYTAKSLQVPWYLVAGNHDHHGNVSAQIAYSAVSKRWCAEDGSIPFIYRNFPDFYYYKEFASSSGNFSVGFVMMDTIQLCGPTEDHIQEQPTGPVDAQSAVKQWNFVKETLTQNRATYLFTAGHYPVYSIAEHGPTACLVKQLQPMLDTYGVNGHLSGHDHNIQHLRMNSSRGGNIDYFVSGMANFIDWSTAHKDDVPPGSSLFHYADLLSKGAFLYAEATASNMTLIFINANGKQVYSTVVYPRKV